MPERELSLLRRRVAVLEAAMQAAGMVVPPADAPDPTPFPMLEAHFRSLWDASPDLLLVVDAKGALVHRNHAARSLPPCETLDEVFRDREALAALLARDRPVESEQDLTLIDGRQVLLSATDLGEPHGADHTLVVLRDVSGRRRLERELAVTRNTAAIAQLALAVANEINNPLAVVLGRIELLSALREAEPSAIAAHLSVMGDHARHIASILQSLQAVSRSGRDSCAEIPVSQLLEGAQRAAGRRLGNVELDIEVHPPDLAAVGDRALLEQALGSLLINSATAMHRRGRVEIRGLAQNGNCVIQLRDFGAAPPRGIRELLEVPQAPMDMLSAGVGLGLVVANLILRDHGGRLTVSTDGSRGALYTVLLPRQGALASKGSPLVLVVDGGGDIAARARSALAPGSSSLRVVTSGREALRVLEDWPVDLLLVAMVLPGQTGLSLRRAVVRRWPALAPRAYLVVSSGAGPVPGVPTLPDTFGAEELQSVVAQLRPNPG